MKKNYGFILSLIAVFIVLVFVSWLTMQIQNSKSNNPILMTVSVAEFKAEYDNLKTDNAILIDVRTPSEYNDGHLRGSINIDFNSTDSFYSQLDKLDKNTKYLIYCQSGNRSTQALSVMQNKGFQNVYNLKGGMNVWAQDGRDSYIEK